MIFSICVFRMCLRVGGLLWNDFLLFFCRVYDWPGGDYLGCGGYFSFASTGKERIMDIKKRFTVQVGTVERLSIFMVGCGGTGSFAALHLGRLVWALRGRVQVSLVFVDPDRIEMKNVGRQNFCPAEVGTFKALSLAERVSRAFGIKVWGITERFGKRILDEFRCSQFDNEGLTVVVGAVDNGAARRDIARACHGDQRYRTWWVDAGNGLDGGQVLVGNRPDERPVLVPGFCAGLPFPSVQEPGLFEDQVVEERLGCADLLAMGAQSLMINQAMGGWLVNYVYRLVLARDLDVMGTYINLRSGSVRSVPITDGVMLDKPEQSMPDYELLERMRDQGQGVCPTCGQGLAQGQDEIDDIEQDVVFCPDCGWMATIEDWAMGIVY